MDIFLLFKFLARKFNRSFISFLIITTILLAKYPFFDVNSKGASNLVKNSKHINHNVKYNDKVYDSDSIIYSRQNVGKGRGKNRGRVFGLPIISDLIKTKEAPNLV
ncbi:3635_t:CDS:1, partial [Cetraspora pellucida]